MSNEFKSCYVLEVKDAKYVQNSELIYYYPTHFWRDGKRVEAFYSIDKRIDISGWIGREKDNLYPAWENVNHGGWYMIRNVYVLADTFKKEQEYNFRDMPFGTYEEAESYVHNVIEKTMN